jgi:hypothetical protein
MRFPARRDGPGVRRDHATTTDATLLAAEGADAFAVCTNGTCGRCFAWARPRVGEHAADLTAEVFARA